MQTIRTIYSANDLYPSTRPSHLLFTTTKDHRFVQVCMVECPAVYGPISAHFELNQPARTGRFDRHYSPDGKPFTPTPAKDHSTHEQHQRAVAGRWFGRRSRHHGAGSWPGPGSDRACPGRGWRDGSRQRSSPAPVRGRLGRGIVHLHEPGERSCVEGTRGGGSAGGPFKEGSEGESIGRGAHESPCPRRIGRGPDHRNRPVPPGRGGQRLYQHHLR